MEEGLGREDKTKDPRALGTSVPLQTSTAVSTGDAAGDPIVSALRELAL